MSSPSRRMLPLLVALIACSGTAGSELFPPSEIASTEPDGASPSPSPSPSAPAATAAPTPTAAPTAQPPPGPRDASAPEPPPDPHACTPEREPNDRLDQATGFSSKVCGAMGSPSDVDFVQVVAPPGKTKMTFEHTEAGGRLSYRIYEDGDVRVSNANTTTSLEVEPGVAYAIRITPSYGATSMATYEVRVAFP